MLKRNQEANGAAALRSRGPKSYSKPELERLGVAVLDESNVRLQCLHCQAIWSSNLLPGARLPARYWQCPNGCNRPVSAGKVAS